MPGTLSSNKYLTPFRIVTGTPQLFPNDVVLLCDTSLAPVVLNMLDIPINYWSTQWSLYVVDISNNASFNNITINAGIGQLVNGLSNIVINTNGAYSKLVIGGNAKFLSQNSTSGGGTSFFVVTNAQLLALINASTIVQGAFYYVTDANQWVNGMGVVVQGVLPNGVSVEGTGIYLNADYQNVGNYSGVGGFGNNLGIWGLTPLPVAINDVVVWNNQHYLNLVGAWGGIEPNLDLVNWNLLAPSITSGYINENDFVKYNVLSNEVLFRADKRQNEVDLYIDKLFPPNNTLVSFQWGRNKCEKNKISGESVWKATNSNCQITSNVLLSGFLEDLTAQPIPLFIVGFIRNNVITNYGKLFSNRTLGDISNNVISQNGSLSVFSLLDTFSVIKNNNIESEATLEFDIINGSSVITQNIVIQNSKLTNTTTLGSTYIVSCFVSNTGYFEVGINGGLALGQVIGCEVSDNNIVILPILNSQYINFKIRKDFSNWEWELSIADFLGGLLTIPIGKEYAGIFTCTGLGAVIVDKISNLSTNHNSKFVAFEGESVSFLHTLIGVAVPLNLVSETGIQDTLIGRINGTDFIRYQISGSLIQRTNLTINA